MNARPRSFGLRHTRMKVAWEPLWPVLLSRTIIVGAVVMLSQPARVAGAEEQPDNEWEAGCQTTIIRLAVPSERSLGLGGRIGRTLSTHIAVEAEANHFPENPGGNFGETQVVGGVKAGARVGSWSGFIKIRPGWLRFGGRDFRARNSASNYAVLDLGAVAERSITDRIAFRMDAGNTLIFFGGGAVNTAVGTLRPGTESNLQISFGLGFKF